VSYNKHAKLVALLSHIEVLQKPCFPSNRARHEGKNISSKLKIMPSAKRGKTASHTGKAHHPFSYTDGNIATPLSGQ
jgi:hypothetical protein